MNVLIVTPWYRPAVGGVVETVANLTAHLVRRRIHVTLLLHGDDDLPRKVGHDGDVEVFAMRLRAPQDYDNRIYGLAVTGLLYVPTWFRLRRFLVSRRIDLVNVHFPSSQHVYFAWPRRRRLRLVLSVHGSDVRYHARRDAIGRAAFGRCLLTRCDALVACSRSLLDEAAMAAHDRFKGRSEVIYGGVAQEWIEDSTTSNESDLLLAVGQLRDIKGFDVLIRAFRSVVDRFPQMRLCLAGEGPLKDGLRELAGRLGVAERVEFRGHLERGALRELYRQARLCVIPSFNEGLSLVALEAQALGKAVVASRVGGIPELIDSGVNGLLVEPGDPRVLAEGITRLLDDPALGRELGEKGRARVRDRFTWEACGRRYLELFSELTSIRPEEG